MAVFAQQGYPWLRAGVIAALILAPLVLAETADRHTRELQRYQSAAETFPICQPLVDEQANDIQALRLLKQQAQGNTDASRQLTRAMTKRRAQIGLCFSNARRATRGYAYATKAMMALARADDWLATADRDGNVFVWNLATGQSAPLQHSVRNPRHLDISADGTRILLNGGNQTTVIHTLDQHPPQKLLLRLPVFAQNLLIGGSVSRDHIEVRQYDPESATYQPHAKWSVGRVQTLAVSSNGRWAWTGHHLVDLKNGAQHSLQPQPSAAWSAAFSADNQLLYMAKPGGVISVYNVASRDQSRELNLAEKGPGGAKILPNPENTLLAVRYPLAIHIVDLHSGTLVAQLQADKQIRAVEFVGELLAIAGDDGTAKLLSLRTGKLQGSLLGFESGNWAVLGEMGHYDAARAGEIAELSWQAQQRSLALVQLKEQYWHPGLLHKLVNHIDPGATRPPTNQPPIVTVKAKVNSRTPNKTRTDAIELGLADAGDGVGQVRILVNNKEIPLQRALGAGEHHINIPAERILPGQQNAVEVIAWDNAGQVASRGQRVTWHDDNAATAKPTLYAVIAGIADYSGDTIDLQFAGHDADRFAGALKIAASRLFGTDAVQMTVLRDGQATKASLQQAFASARQGNANDVLVVYLAGHGVSERDQYYYLTADAADLTQTNARHAVSSAELVDWINALPMNKQVMVLDTCAAGALHPSLLAARGLPTDQIRAIERLKDRTGFHVLMGSAADRYSYEANDYGQGLLTYALLEGMRGEALRDAKFVDVSRLFQHALDRVPQLARNLGGVQQPVLAAPHADSFDIGWLAPEDRQRIPLANRRLLISPPTFLEASSGFDRWRITDAVVNALHHSVTDNSRLALAGMPVPHGVSLSGSYTVEEAHVVVRTSLLKDGQLYNTSETTVPLATNQIDTVQRTAAAVVATIVPELTAIHAALR